MLSLIFQMFLKYLEKRGYTILPPGTHYISWSVEDFRQRAEEVEGKDWEKVYDPEKFGYALKKMFINHDANIGVSWDVIDVYLDEYCLREGSE